MKQQCRAGELPRYWTENPGRSQRQGRRAYATLNEERKDMTEEEAAKAIDTGGEHGT